MTTGGQSRNTRWTWALVALLCWLACAATRQPVHRPAGGLAFAGNPPGAIVTINESLAGTIGHLGQNPIHLQAGTYRVQVTAPGYFPWYAEWTVGETVETVVVELRPIPE